MLSDAPGSVGTTPIAQSLPITKEYADRALAEDPQSADALFALGGYYGQVYATGELKYLDKAIETTRKAIAVRPSFPQAENDLAYYLARKGEVPEATGIIAGVLQRDPGLRDANVLYGDWLSLMGRLDEAAAALDRWEKISPGQPDIAAMRLSMLARRGDLAAAWRASEDLTLGRRRGRFDAFPRG